MQVHEKRKLLEAVDILIHRPAFATETTLAEAMAYFKMLIEESTQGQIEVRYSDTTQQLPF
ncbi:hypothetical protein FJU95_00215 [Acinetobacter baumannii]|uniref:hypothetical protein n=1 Tax=Acinetobacter baumannii TaxID=470 RepID=UPI001128B70A|nr:hypothetical protein [Acinetobacter baumannii]TPU89734.1 hypothetical protein FJU95_00215 [Acinetobacter baumannii]